jgi:hypothetical protein
MRFGALNVRSAYTEAGFIRTLAGEIGMDCLDLGRYRKGDISVEMGVQTSLKDRPFGH